MNALRRYRAQRRCRAQAQKKTAKSKTSFCLLFARVISNMGVSWRRRLRHDIAR